MKKQLVPFWNILGNNKMLRTKVSRIKQKINLCKICTSSLEETQLYKPGDEKVR